jgi:tRNA(Leu) C34 or U34 (ribose-2'-O)-methylase TrmL
VIWSEDVLAACPHECIPVAVEFIQTACPLPAFQHPERAFYVFGPEDGSLPKDVLSRCHALVYVPTDVCMNLAATVNVVLYDRIAKAA